MTSLACCEEHGRPDTAAGCSCSTSVDEPAIASMTAVLGRPRSASVFVSPSRGLRMRRWQPVVRRGANSRSADACSRHLCGRMWVGRRDVITGDDSADTALRRKTVILRIDSSPRISSERIHHRSSSSSSRQTRESPTAGASSLTNLAGVNN